MRAAAIALVVGLALRLADAGSRVVDDLPLVGASPVRLADGSADRVQALGSPPPGPLDPRAPGAHLDGFAARELRALPGIGRGRAQRVVAQRAERGGHLALADWTAIDGVGPTTVDRLRADLERAGASEERRRRAREPRRASESDRSVAIASPDT